jgi:5-methylcytosine-specific restriction endonuclease McrA
MVGKVCTKCALWKSAYNFHKNKQCVGGFRSICKECVNREKRYLLAIDEEYAISKRIGEKVRRLKRIENDPSYRERENRLRNKSRKIRRADPLYRQAEYDRDNSNNRKRYANDIEYREKMLNLATAFAKTEKGIETHKKARAKYKISEKGIEAKKREIRSEAFRLRVNRYQQSEKGKATLRPSLYRNNMKRRSNKYHVEFRVHDRLELLERDSWTCQSCGIKVHDRRTGDWNTPDKANIDHIIPISKGGNSEPSNLQILCRTCNFKKKDKIIQVEVKPIKLIQDVGD